ncbi:vesicle-associated membrane protein 5 isoform X1 [Esox lucius]|uniref:V-SNARE coiled-coil homology domain-containing protein n=1 Tax=Esox lucius TaxID=8010 RepID=A0A6Q2YF83_ESOLU|nr:vesicle-associated membrane protein 5 isoform X1 [Esox lucius]
MFILKSVLKDGCDTERILPSQENGKNRLQQTQEEVEEVKVIMLENLNKADERSGRLGELENRADQLLEKSKAFSKSAGKVKQQRCWEHMKIKVLLVVVGVVVIAAIFIGIIASVAHGSGNSSSGSQTSNSTGLNKPQ